MSRGFTSNKRQREDERARKQRDKERRRAERRASGPGEIPVESAADALRGLPSVEEAMLEIERRAASDHSAPTIGARLFVGGLADDVTEADLRAAFSAIGPVTDAQIARDRATRQPRGFGFVTMADRRDGPIAIARLHGTELAGRNMVVNVATERGSR